MASKSKSRTRSRRQTLVDKFTRPSNKGGRRKSTPFLVDIDPTSTAWELYNHRAAKIDEELIKDWNDTLNTLLIFAALFSAILTAFIIESMKLLQEKSEDIMVGALIRVSNQLSNSSLSSFQSPDFEPPPYAARVNYCFFASISCSLVAALGAVVGLQWVGGYDSGLITSSAEERAIQRQFRHMGVQTWKMTEIIATLPILIFSALFLFFIGLADWLLHIHTGVAAVVITGLSLSALLFSITTTISTFISSAPYRTPMTRFLPRLTFRPISWAVMLVIHPLLKIVSFAVINILPAFYQFAFLVLVRLPILLCRAFAFTDFSGFIREAVELPLPFLRALRNAFTAVLSLLGQIARLFYRGPKLIRKATIAIRDTAHSGAIKMKTSLFVFWTDLKKFIRDAQNVRETLDELGRATAFEREEAGIKASPTLKLDGLKWLASTIELSQYSRWQFVILMQEILRLPPDQILRFPWDTKLKNFVMETICAPYRRLQSHFRPTEEELNELTFVSQAVTIIALAENAKSEDRWSLLQSLAERFPECGTPIYLSIAELLFQQNFDQALETLIAERQKISDEFFMFSFYKLRSNLIAGYLDRRRLAFDLPAIISQICQKARDNPLSPSLLNSLMVLACEYMHEKEFPSDINLEGYLDAMSNASWIHAQNLTIYHSIADQILARLRACRTAETAENVIQDVYRLTSWRNKSAHVSSTLHVVVDDIFNLLDRLGLKLTDFKPSEGHKLLGQATNAIFSAMDLPDTGRVPPGVPSKTLKGDKIYTTDSAYGFVTFLSRINWYMSSRKRLKRRVPRVNNIQFITTYCMPLYFKHKWTFTDDNIGSLKGLTSPNVQLQLSLIQPLNIDVPILPRTDWIWTDDSWHASILCWALAVGRGMRSGDRRIFPSSTISYLLASPAMDYILRAQIKPADMGYVLPTLLQVKELSFWEDFDTSGGHGLLEKVHQNDSECTIDTVKILCLIVYATRGRSAIKSSIELLSRCLLTGKEHESTLDFTDEAEKLSDVLQEMILDRPKYSGKFVKSRSSSPPNNRYRSYSWGSERAPSSIQIRRRRTRSRSPRRMHLERGRSYSPRSVLTDYPSLRSRSRQTVRVIAPPYSRSRRRSPSPIIIGEVRRPRSREQKPLVHSPERHIHVPPSTRRRPARYPIGTRTPSPLPPTTVRPVGPHYVPLQPIGFREPLSMVNTIRRPHTVSPLPIKRLPKPRRDAAVIDAQQQGRYRPIAIYQGPSPLHSTQNSPDDTPISVQEHNAVPTKLAVAPATSHTPHEYPIINVNIPSARSSYQPKRGTKVRRAPSLSETRRLSPVAIGTNVTTISPSPSRIIRSQSISPRRVRSRSPIVVHPHNPPSPIAVVQERHSATRRLKSPVTTTVERRSRSRTPRRPRVRHVSSDSLPRSSSPSPVVLEDIYRPSYRLQPYGGHLASHSSPTIVGPSVVPGYSGPPSIIHIGPVSSPNTMRQPIIVQPHVIMPNEPRSRSRSSSPIRHPVVVRGSSPMRMRSRRSRSYSPGMIANNWREYQPVIVMESPTRRSPGWRSRSPVVLRGSDGSSRRSRSFVRRFTWDSRRRQSVNTTESSSSESIEAILPTTRMSGGLRRWDRGWRSPSPLGIASKRFWYRTAPEEEWEQFCSLFQKVIDAIKIRSFVQLDNPYPRDPDGLCFFKESQRQVQATVKINPRSIEDLVLEGEHLSSINQEESFGRSNDAIASYSRSHSR